MNTDNFGVIQPDDDKLLFRYMDKWKFDSLCNCRFVFTNAKNQDDPYDCINLYQSSGYTRRANYMRRFTLLSCWTMDDSYDKNKLLQYCKFRDMKEKEDCELAYVIKTTYSKLIEFLKIKYVKDGLVTANHLSWQLRYGKVEYVDHEKINGTICEGLDNSCFYKDIDRYKNENEFRIIAKLGSSVNKYSEKHNTHIPTNKKYPEVIWLQGNPTDFLIDVYEFSKKTEEFRKIGIPYIPCKTIKPTFFKPTKI